MTFIEKQNEYKKTTRRIGWCMLILLGLMSVGSFLSGIAEGILSLVASERNAHIITGVIGALSYMAYFLIPVIFYFLVYAKNGEKPNMRLEFKLPGRMIVYIFALLGINLVAALINSILVAPFGFDKIYELVMPTYPDGFHMYDFIIETISTALAPAFVEELLFRGLVLACLIPFGKKTAIFGSAILFAFMHQNPGQLVYTFVCGVILAIMVIESQSIWSGIIAHFLNNMVSVVATALPYMVGVEKADLISGIISLALIFIGVICAVIITVSKLSERRNKSASPEQSSTEDNSKDEYFASDMTNTQDEGIPEAIAEDCSLTDGGSTDDGSTDDGSTDDGYRAVAQDYSQPEIEAVSDNLTEDKTQGTCNSDTQGSWKDDTQGSWKDDTQGSWSSDTQGARNYDINGAALDEQRDLSAKDKITGFFSKPTIVFLALCVAEMVLLLFTALLMNVVV